MKYLLALLLFPVFAWAQSFPNGPVTQGQVWDISQWNSAWQSKLDYPVGAGTIAPSALTSGALPSGVLLPPIAAGSVLGVPAQATGQTIPTALRRPTFYVQDFGAKCDNSTDDTSALASAFAAAEATRFSSVILPPGVCRFSSTLNFPTNYSSVRGAGKYTTVLFYTGATTTADLVDIFGTSISVLGVSSTYSGFSVQSASAMTGGAGINIKWMVEVWLDDFATGGFYDATNNLYNGTIVQSSGEIRLSNFEASKLANDGIEVFGGGVGAPPQYDVNMHHFEIQSDGNAGVHMGGGWDGMNLDEGTLVSNGTNILIDTALSSFGNQEAIFGPRVYLNLAEANGTNIGDNIVINDSLASPTNYCSVTFNGVIADSVHENGINVVHWPACLLSIAATDIVNNAKSGIYVQDTSTIVNVSNVTQIYGNTRYGIEGSSATSNVHSLASLASNTLGSYSNILNPQSTISNVVAQTGLPIAMPSSGSIGNNCAITGLTAMPYTYPAIYLYFPAGAISSGSAAGLYYTVMSSATAGTCYNNKYTSGTPAIPASPVAFSTTGPGAFTQTTGTYESMFNVNVPAGAIGLNGEVQIDFPVTVNNTSNNKLQALYATGGQLVASATLTTASQTYSYRMRNVDNQSIQFTTAASGGLSSRSTVATGSGLNLIEYCQLATATDYCIIEGFSIKLAPN